MVQQTAWETAPMARMLVWQMVQWMELQTELKTA
jgi:hypothetical protein